MLGFVDIWKKIFSPWQRLKGEVTRRVRYGLIGCLLAAFLVIIFIPSSTLVLEYQVLDLFQGLVRGFRSPQSDLLLVGIDADTLAYVPDRWPWPRERFAQLVEVIASGGPRTLIWDLTLDHLEKAGGSPGDRRLAAAFRWAGQVTLVSTVEVRQTPEGLRKRLFRNDPLFRDVASLEGFACCAVDGDGVFRRFILRDGNLGADSCALQVFQALTGESCLLPPSDATGQASSFLAFATQGGEIPAVKAVDLLRGAVEPALLKDKIVVVGPTAPVLQDYHLTPRGVMAGPRILATALDTLLQRRIAWVEDGWLARLAAAALGCLGGLLIAGLVTTHPIFWSGIGLALATGGWALMLGFRGVHLPWGTLAACWILATLAQSSLRDFLRYLDERVHLAEAAAAARVQGKMFPIGPWDRGEYLIQGVCQPCQAAGGDYYDFLPMSQDRLMFIIADVSGHGIGAAMVTCMVKAVAGMLVEFDQLGPSEFIRYVNALLHQTFHRTRLMTTMLGYLQPANHQVTLVNAGHLPAFLIRQDGRVEEVGQPSLPLGTKAGRSADKHMGVIMNPGDALVLYTDGIPECLNWENRQYGFDRWISFLARILPSLPMGAPLTALLADVEAHAEGRPHDDDVTLVVLRRRLAPATS